MADVTEWTESEVGVGEKFVESVGEGVGQFAMEADADIAPAAIDAVAFVFGADIETADKGCSVVADEEFAVIAKAEAVEFKGIEAANFGPGSAQGVPKIFGERH